MKILLIHPSFSSEGAKGSEIIAQDTYSLLKKAGHDVYFFATDKKPYLENTNWTKYFPRYMPRFSPKWWWNFEAQNNLSKMLDDIKPELVHIHTIGQLSYSVFKPVLSRKIPVVMTLHDTGLSCPVAQGWRDKTICSKCKGLNTFPCIINNCIRTQKRLSSFNMAVLSLINKLSGYNKKINKFITPSKALADYIQCKDIPSSKIEVIPNFLNSNYLNKIQLSNNQDYFLYVGTLADYKGVDTLLKAIKELPKEISFKIIGSGFQENKYKNFAKENKLTNVEFLGNLNRTEIIKYYANCISLIVPSNCFETFGMINLEAFACKRPVIASNIGGIGEIVEQNKNGFLFDPQNVKQLKDCILNYWNNKDLAASHGNNGFELVQEKYLQEQYLKKLENIYQEIIDYIINLH